MDINSILAAISTGAIDGQEHRIYDAIKIRRKIQELQKGVTLFAKDKVVFNSAASPKYLRGSIVEVVAVNTTTATILVPDTGFRGDTGGRWRPGSTIKAPLSIIDKVVTNGGN